MEFVSGIKAGTNASFVVKRYAKAFVQAVVADPHNWYAEVAHNFVKQCFLAVNLKFKATVEDFENGTDYQYREDNLSYLYIEIPFVLRAIDVFFEELPLQLAAYHATVLHHKCKSDLEKEFYKLTQPLPCYFRLIYAWCRVASSMCDKTTQETWTVDKYLREPLARVSFSICNGLVGLLNDYNNAYPDLKELCLTLAIVVRFGVFYLRTHVVIVSPMLQIFKEHYKIFFDENLGALNFIHYVLICETPQYINNIKVYEFLKLMMTQFGQSQEVDERGQLYLHHLTKKLVENNFIEIQFDEFSKSISRPLLIAGLNYLLTLQEHILSTDCFSRRFLESILHIILRINTTSVKSLAAKLYAKLALRQFDDMEVMMHILEAFYKLHHLKRGSVTYKNFTDSLKMYIKALLSNCEDLMSFENILYILNNKFVRHELALLSAQAIIVLYKIHQDCALTNDRSKQQVIYMLQHLPHCITEAQSVEIRNVLYSVYDAVNMNVFKEEKEILSSLEKFFLHNFLNDYSLTDSEVRTIYLNIKRSTEVTGNTRTLETAAPVVLEEFENIRKSIAQQEIAPDKLKKRLYICVRRLNAIFKNGGTPMRFLGSVYTNLFNLFLGEYSKSDSLAAYGLETLAYMCVNLAEDQEQPEEEFNKSLKIAQDLSIACRIQLHSSLTTDRHQQYNKFMFCAIMIVHLRLGENLAMDRETYDVLIDAYLMAIDNLQRRGDTLACDYFKEMSALFLALHMKRYYLLPSKRIWKVVVIYGSSGSCSDTVMLELKKLIVVLLRSRIEIYAHCLPIIYMHINHNSSTKSRIISAFADHIALIDKHASPMDAWLLKSHTLVTTLELIEKSFTVRRKSVNSSGNNRLIALAYLLPLFVCLRFDEHYFQYFAELIYKIREQSLNARERRELEEFISNMSVHKQRCESKNNDVHSFVENKNIQLKDRPIGPVPEWYFANDTLNGM